MKVLLAIFATALILGALFTLAPPADTEAIDASVGFQLPDNAAPVVHSGIETQSTATPESVFAESEQFAKSEQVDKNPPELVLYGTLVGDTPGLSFAMIAAAGSSEALNYRTGEMLPGGSWLQRVAERHVEVLHGDVTHIVAMQNLESIGETRQAEINNSLSASAREAEAMAVGLTDGETGDSVVDAPSTAPTGDVYRSRSGPVLSTEQRAEMEQLALEN